MLFHRSRASVDIDHEDENGLAGEENGIGSPVSIDLSKDRRSRLKEELEDSSRPTWTPNNIVRNQTLPSLSLHGLAESASSVESDQSPPIGDRFETFSEYEHFGYDPTLYGKARTTKSKTSRTHDKKRSRRSSQKRNVVNDTEADADLPEVTRTCSPDSAPAVSPGSVPVVLLNSSVQVCDGEPFLNSLPRRRFRHRSRKQERLVVLI